MFVEGVYDCSRAKQGCAACFEDTHRCSAIVRAHCAVPQQAHPGPDRQPLPLCSCRVCQHQRWLGALPPELTQRQQWSLLLLLLFLLLVLYNMLHLELPHTSPKSRPN